MVFLEPTIKSSSRYTLKDRREFFERARRYSLLNLQNKNNTVPGLMNRRTLQSNASAAELMHNRDEKVKALQMLKKMSMPELVHSCKSPTTNLSDVSEGNSQQFQLNSSYEPSGVTINKSSTNTNPQTKDDWLCKLVNPVSSSTIRITKVKPKWLMTPYQEIVVIADVHSQKNTPEVTSTSGVQKHVESSPIHENLNKATNTSIHSIAKDFNPLLSQTTMNFFNSDYSSCYSIVNPRELSAAPKKSTISHKSNMAGVRSKTKTKIPLHQQYSSNESIKTRSTFSKNRMPLHLRCSSNESMKTRSTFSKSRMPLHLQFSSNESIKTRSTFSKNRIPLHLQYSSNESIKTGSTFCSNRIPLHLQYSSNATIKTRSTFSKNKMPVHLQLSSNESVKTRPVSSKNKIPPHSSFSSNISIKDKSKFSKNEESSFSHYSPKRIKLSKEYPVQNNIFFFKAHNPMPQISKPKKSLSWGKCEINLTESPEGLVALTPKDLISFSDQSIQNSDPSLKNQVNQTSWKEIDEIKIMAGGDMQSFETEKSKFSIDSSDYCDILSGEIMKIASNNEAPIMDASHQQNKNIYQPLAAVAKRLISKLANFNANVKSWVEGEIKDIDREQIATIKCAENLDRQLRALIESNLCTTEDVDALMSQWVKMINCKNCLLTRQMRLVALEKESVLNRRQKMLNSELECRYSIKDQCKTSDEQSEDEALLQNLVQIVDSRNKLVHYLATEFGNEKSGLDICCEGDVSSSTEN